MTSLRMLVTAFAVALFSAAPLAAHATLASNAGPATTWHVAPGGNDTAGGGPDAPLSTIDEAFDRALPGDTILLLAGQHPNAILEAKSGTAQAPITVVGSTGAVIGASPGQPALALHDTAHIALVNVHVDAGSAGVELIEAHSVSIDGLVASDTNGHAISIADSNDVRLEDCRVIDSAGDGIHATDSSSLLLDRCRFSSVAGTAVRLDTVDAEVRNNRISGAAGGIIANGVNSLSIVTANNISDIGPQAAIRVDGPARIVNNSVIGAAGNAIVLGAGAANSGEGAVLHNTTWAVSGSPFENHAIKPARVENNLGIDHPGNRTASSGDFVNAAAGDLRLSAESLALDTASESEVTTDQRGRTRPLGNGPDFGAFESSHSAPSPPDTSMPTETIAQAPNPEDIPTGLGEAGVVEREPSPDDSQTNAAPPQHETDTSQDVETDADGTGTETMTVKDAEGDVALADPSNGEKRTETGLIAPPSTYPPLSYRTVTDGGTPSVAGAIAAGCVVLAGGAGGLAMAFNRRRTAEIEEGDPWQQHEPF